jgi:ribonuclease-3
MPPVVVFSTTSDIEASVVLALLDSQGISGFRITGNPQAILPMSMSPLGEVRIAVPDEIADEARRIIESHREDVGARVVRLRNEFDEIEARIDYRFKDRGLLEHALTHKSRAAEDVSGGVADNESLEFLGDAVLGLVVADALFRQYPTYDEGQKSKIKASVVSTQALARQAEEIRLGDHLILGRGEEKTGGRFKQALLADAYEALIAAIYLDGGIEAAETFLRRELKEAIDAGAARNFVGQDYKSALQERVQALGRPLPEYRIAGEAGPDHRKIFSIEVVVGGEVLGAAIGKAKKEAEQEAARLALEGRSVCRKADLGSAPLRQPQEAGLLDRPNQSR